MWKLKPESMGVTAPTMMDTHSGDSTKPNATCFIYLPSGKRLDNWKITISYGNTRYQRPFSIAILVIARG